MFNRSMRCGLILASLLAICAVAQAAGPAPGIYQLRSASSDWCVGYRAGGGLRLPYLATGDCQKLYQRSAGTPLPLILLGIPAGLGGSETPGYSPIAVVPRPGGGFTLRSVPPYYAVINGTPNDANRLLSCVTVARNVVVGPPGIDIWPCDLGNGAPWSQAGGIDQRFYFTPAAGDGNYTIATFQERQYACIDVRGASQNINTDLISWACNHQQNQVFHLTWLGPLTTRDDIATAQPAGPSGLLSSIVIQPPGVLPSIQHGINYPGMDLSSSETASDDGMQCAQLCRANAQCRAFSWVRPGIQRGSAMCWLKSGVPTAKADPNVNSGIIQR